MKLVLFDIDGTLLLTDGAGKRAIFAALLEVFGSTGPADHRFDGKTDRQIVRELMRLTGLSDASIDTGMTEVLDRYLVHLERELRDDSFVPHLFEGVPEILDALEERDDAIVGLLTGNLEGGAHAKLRRLNLDPARFRVGAFGSDHEHRHELPRIAQQRAVAQLGREIPGDAVVVIGDTPHDISCGRGIGARAIGVATGYYAVEELQACSPHLVLKDLASTEEVLKAIFDD